MAALKAVGMASFANHYPNQLSVGMRQRVNMARGICVKTNILLMDEPFAALDAQTREVLQEELLRLMNRPDERKTMIFITHSIDEAIVLADRIVVMTPRPGTIHEILEMPFGWPRDLQAIRLDPRFEEFRAHIWEELRPQRPARAPERAGAAR
jgi:NitT/TauT family transport system ATP-binding protein